MPDPITIRCASDISNIFTRSQYHLTVPFDEIEGMESTWADVIPNAGSFPIATGYAARMTTLAQQRLQPAVLNGWVDMAGLQPDCAVSCDPPTQFLEYGNAQHIWYRLQTQAFNTRPYCLESMLGDALNLPQQIQQIFMDLKYVTNDVRDEFGRNNFVGISQNRWLGYDAGTASSPPLRAQWRFATDANGNVDTTYIILNPTVNPNNISTLSTDFLNYIRNEGTYIATFPKDGEIPLMVDYDTFTSLPKYDTLRRQDMRFREPSKSDPSYASISIYGGWQLKADQFMLRYNWTTDDPLYPAGVLKRVFHWGNQQLTEGCMSVVSDDYLQADFALAIPLSNKPVLDFQNGVGPTSFGEGVNFAATADPWNGNWRWHNPEADQFLPCNVDRNKGYWRSVWKMAARPRDFGKHGHVVLYRRFPQLGIARNCAPLKVTSTASVDCTNTCPALDIFPPTLEDIYTCGSWNESGCSNP